MTTTPGTRTGGLPSTLPREPHCYDPTTSPQVDERGVLHLYGYDDVRAGLLDDEQLTIDLSGFPDPVNVTCRFVWGTDRLTFSGRPGRHPLLRGLAEPMFTVDAVAALAPLVTAAADDAITAAFGRGHEVDLYHDLAVPYALRVTCALVGITEAEGARLIEYQRAMAELTRTWPPPVQEEADEMLAAVHARPAEPGTVVDRAVCAHARGDITTREAWAQTWGYVQAGVLTTASALTALIGLLVEHGVYGTVVLAGDDRAVLARAADEALRYAAVFPTVVKTVRVPHERGGNALQPGQQVALWLSAADRDPAVNGAAGANGPDPATFDPGRAPNRTLALSAGSHYCTGARLSRAELVTMLQRLRERGVEVGLRPGWQRYAGVEDGFAAAPVTLSGRR